MGDRDARTQLVRLCRLHARQRGELEGSSGERSDFPWRRNYKRVSVPGWKVGSRDGLVIHARTLYPVGTGAPSGLLNRA